MPRRWPVSKEGTKPPEPGFCVEVTVMMTAAKNEEPVAWNRPQGGGGIVQEHDQTPGECVARDASLEDGKLVHRCQSLTGWQ